MRRTLPGPAQEGLFVSETDYAAHAPQEDPPHGRAGAQLAAVLDGAARDLLSRNGEETVAHTLGLIVAGAVASIPHVDRAGISYVHPDKTVTSEAPSDDVVTELDAL
jgi:hypothetical protein